MKSCHRFVCDTGYQSAANPKLWDRRSCINNTCKHLPCHCYPTREWNGYKYWPLHVLYLLTRVDSRLEK